MRNQCISSTLRRMCLSALQWAEKKSTTDLWRSSKASKEQAMAAKHPLDGIEPPSNRGGRQPALKPLHVAVKQDIVEERAPVSLREICDELHRRGDVPPYSTNLTDGEWKLFRDLFRQAPDQRGSPVHHGRWELVNACSDVLRTCCAWRLLSVSFPLW